MDRCNMNMRTELFSAEHDAWYTKWESGWKKTCYTSIISETELICENWWHYCCLQRRIWNQCTRRAPMFQMFWVWFRKFWLYNMHFFNCSQHIMFPTCILFSTLTTKTVFKGASKQSQDPKNSTTSELAPWFWNS